MRHAGAAFSFAFLASLCVARCASADIGPVFVTREGIEWSAIILTVAPYLVLAIAGHWAGGIDRPWIRRCVRGGLVALALAWTMFCLAGPPYDHLRSRVDRPNFSFPLDPAPPVSDERAAPSSSSAPSPGSP
jgi:hypothetical protein